MHDNPVRSALTLLTLTAALAGCVEAEPETTGLPGGKADAEGEDTARITPEMKWLAARSEDQLARIFAQGGADRVPTGPSVGYPILADQRVVGENTGGLANWFASQFWGGKTLKQRTAPGGGARYHENGDPAVSLDNMIIQTPWGAALDIFDAEVTRNPLVPCSAAQVPGRDRCLVVGAYDDGGEIAPPSGIVEPYWLSLFQQGIAIDDRTSVTLNYFGDTTFLLGGIIRRILDEVREVAPETCPGLWLGRAHIRPLSGARSEWRFWTYFMLDFGRPDGTACQLDELAARLGTPAP